MKSTREHNEHLHLDPCENRELEWAKVREEEVPLSKLMWTHLLAFNVRLHLLHQFTILFRSACRLVKSSCTHCVLISFVSSANMYIEKDVIALGISFIYRRGPRILP